MYRKPARAASAAAITAACLGGAGAAHAATVSVPCSAAALAAAMSSAGSGEMLSLAAGCKYRQASLPLVTADLTITGNGATLRGGSGLAVSAGALTVGDLSFRRARIVVTGLGALSVSGGTFAGSTTAGNGGAIDIDAPAAGGLSIIGAAFTGNTAAGDGGAIFDYSLDDAVITDSTFAGNHAGGSGGAILASPDFEMALGGDVIRGNTAAAGGGIVNDTGMSISGSRITGNHATGPGGGLWTMAGVGEGPGFARVTGTVIRGNSAQDGGGVYNFEGITSISGSMITANYASGAGGGIYADGLAAVVTLTTAPVTRNRPDNCEPADMITGCTS